MSNQKANGAVSDAEIEGFQRALQEVLDEYGDRWPQLLDGKALRLEQNGQFVAVLMPYQEFDA